MASPDAIRALRSLIRTPSTSPLLRHQRRTLCAACLAHASGSAAPRRSPRRSTTIPATSHRVSLIPRPVPRRSAHTSSSPSAQPQTRGPIVEYDARVSSGRLREDPHQRTLILALQDLHDTLAQYSAPTVVHPTVASLQPRKPSFLSSLFGGGGGGGSDGKLQIRPMPGLPRGLYMYGDVGSGKTMLMDLFFDTLPANITFKTRIHFHNFMQDVHRQLHQMKAKHGNDLDAIPFVAAGIAAQASVLCFDEFQCTDVADAMILRRLMESLMHHGTVLVTTSNRHPRELYKNGIQRESFLPCIALLERQLRVLNLDSDTDYRKVPRPPSGVYYHRSPAPPAPSPSPGSHVPASGPATKSPPPPDPAAERHADHWFEFLGDFAGDPPHATVQHVWGREIAVPAASGTACRFAFGDLIGRATGAADYLELARVYDAFVVTDVPRMDLNTREWARRFITFIDACYEARAKLVLTTEVPLPELFEGVIKMKASDEAVQAGRAGGKKGGDGDGVSDAMRSLMDDLGMDMDTLKKSALFTGDEESFAFARALSRLVEMGSREWVERGMGLESRGGKKDVDDWKKVKSNWQQDSY